MFCGFGEAVFVPLDTLLPEHGQTFAVDVEIDQGEVGAAPVVVLRDAPIARFVEAEDALQDAKRMFYFRSHSRLTFILLLL
jgi:hypothetical protein